MAPARVTLVLATLLLLLLAGCSRSTVFTLEADILSFTSAEVRSGELSPFGEFRLPDEDGVSSTELGLSRQLAGTLERLRVDFAVSLASTASMEDIEVGLDFHLSEGADQNPFDAPPVGSDSITLGPGESDILALQFEVSEAENAELLDRLQEGDLRLGVRLYLSSAGTGSVDYELLRARAALSVRPGALLGP